jgi:hypothetical protein
LNRKDAKDAKLGEDFYCRGAEKTERQRGEFLIQSGKDAKAQSRRFLLQRGRASRGAEEEDST